jgi:hypothetical protein
LLVFAKHNNRLTYIHKALLVFETTILSWDKKADDGILHTFEEGGGGVVASAQITQSFREKSGA